MPLPLSSHACTTRAHLCTLLLLPLAAAMTAACSEPAAPNLEPQHEYTIGGDSTGADTTLDRPVALAIADDGTIIVADDGAKQVRFLDPVTHTIRQTLGRAGAGPGEFRRFASLALTPNGHIVVADAGNRRFTELAPDGSIVLEGPSNSMRTEMMAVDRRGRWHVNTRPADPTEGGPSIAILSDDLQSTTLYGNMHLTDSPLDQVQQNALRLSPSADGGMWVLHTYRAFIERYDADGTRRARFDIPLQKDGRDTVGPIVVQADDDRMSVRRLPVAEDLAIIGDTLVIAALRVTPDSTGDRTRLLAFDTAGVLRQTVTLPVFVDRLAASGDRLFTLSFQKRDPARIDVYRFGAAPPR